MRTFKILIAIFLLYMFILPCMITRAETIEEMKARVRSEVRSQYENRPSLTPSSQRAPGEAVKIPKQPQTRKKAADLSMLLDVAPDTALRFASVIMLFAVIPAAIAKSKGRSFVAWWVLGTLFFIIVMPLSLFLKKEKPHAAHGKPVAGSPEKEIKTEERPLKEETPVDPPEGGTVPRDKKSSAALEIYEKIERLAALKAKGILTEDEFKAKKNELLSRI